MLNTIKNLFRRGWLVRMPTPASSFSLLMERLKRNESFAFSRWGDGEWEAALSIRGEQDTNCDGHQYFPSLGKSLRDILASNPPYLLGMQKLAYHKLLGRHIDRFLKENHIRRQWLNADAFHDASSRGKIKVFFDLLSEKKVLLVGPPHLRKLSSFRFEFCEVPAKNCWLEKGRVLSEIRTEITRSAPEIILFCAGMTANWFIDELTKSFHGFMIDVGSLLDPYAGINSRNYHKKLVLVTSSAGGTVNGDAAQEASNLFSGGSV